MEVLFAGTAEASRAFSVREGVLLSKSGMFCEEKIAESGNEAVFRGSVQSLRSLFPGMEKRRNARAEFGLHPKKTKCAASESNRSDSVE
jgi:hypothetical protein